MVFGYEFMDCVHVHQYSVQKIIWGWCGADISPKYNVIVTTSLPRLIIFIIVGTERSTRKWTSWRRKGRWWTVSG